MKKGILALAAVMVLTMSVPQGLYAASDVWEMAESQQYGRKAAGMFGRGLLNAATSPVDLLVHTVEGTQEGPPLIGTLTGLASGLGCTALRASSGIIDVATFWVPGFNGFKVGRSYSNCLESTYSGAPYAPAPVGQQPQTVVAPGQGTYQGTQSPTDYVKKGTYQGSPMDYVKKGTRQSSGAYIK